MSRSVDYRKRNSIYRKRPSIWRWLIPLLLVLLALLLLWLYPMSSFNKQAADYERSAHGTNAKTVAAETYDDLDWGSGSKTVVINSSDAAVNTDAPSLKATSPGSSSVTVVHSNDGPDKFSYERWGYGTYADYVEDHPFEARANYVRYVILDTAGIASPSDYTANNDATYLEDDTLAASYFDESNPPAGFIFCSAAQGYLPQLTVVAPSDKNAFVKLRNSETGETELSFYVRAGYTVKACVPATRCEFSYGLGNTWYGTEEAFGSDGTYAKSDTLLDFTSPTNRYTYTFSVEDANITPIAIDESAFNA